MSDLQAQPTRRSRTRTRRRRRVSVIGVLGELLITAGVVALLFVAWQLWIGDLIYSAQRADEARALSQEWQAAYENDEPSEPPTDEPAQETPIPVLEGSEDAVIFGTMYVPRWGADYAANIAGGVSRPNTLDPIGIGHYQNTPMPGAEGNVALAGHRTTFGKPFNRIADLRIGDAVIIETKEGWYTYRFRTLQYVDPNAGEVLLPVPQQPGVAANGQYLTLTSCSPMYAMTERIIAYTVFDSFTPRSEGAPAALSEVAT